jgi:hypothetical protein
MKNKKTWGIAVGLLLVAVLLAFLLRSGQETVKSDLPDGTSYRLVTAVYTNQFNYQRRYLPDAVRPFAPLIPDLLEEKFLLAGGSIGLGSSGETNLMVVVEAFNENGNPKGARWMRIRDDAGNVHDGNSPRGSLTGGGYSSQIYVPPVLPNRSKELFVELLVNMGDGGWTNIGPFAITNPNFKEHPQWTPEPLPQARSTNDLTATLVRFASGPGSPSVTGNAPLSEATPRSVRLNFDFTENGQPTDQHRVHWVSLADATGNKWEPHFDPIRPTGYSWVTNGMVEFVGGVWPGEDA